MNLSLVIAKLETVPQIKQVQYGNVLIGREDVVEQFPAVYVAPLREMAMDSKTINCVMQTIEEQFEVVMVSDYSSFFEAREAMMAALIGMDLYNDIPSVQAVEMVEGGQVEATGSLVYWRDIFSARRERRFIP